MTNTLLVSTRLPQHGQSSLIIFFIFKLSTFLFAEYIQGDDDQQLVVDSDVTEKSEDIGLFFICIIIYCLLNVSHCSFHKGS